MPARSSSRPMITPPTANPTIASVNGNVASARGTANSACTAGSDTTTDHMPTPPMVEISMVAARRNQACAESGAGEFTMCGDPGESIGRNSPTRRPPSTPNASGDGLVLAVEHPPRDPLRLNLGSAFEYVEDAGVTEQPRRRKFHGEAIAAV